MNSVLQEHQDLIENKKVSDNSIRIQRDEYCFRVFFKDFYDMLSPSYNIYRLLPEGLLPDKKI